MRLVHLQAVSLLAISELLKAEGARAREVSPGVIVVGGDLMPDAHFPIEAALRRGYEPPPVLAIDAYRAPPLPAMPHELLGGLAGLGLGLPLARMRSFRSKYRDEKTPDDLERMAAAQAKRDRRAARKGGRS